MLTRTLINDGFSIRSSGSFGCSWFAGRKEKVEHICYFLQSSGVKKELYINAKSSNQREIRMVSSAIR
jgi:hypothetical protein